MVSYYEYLFLQGGDACVKYDVDRRTCVISVRELCYLACRHGNLGSRSGAMADKVRDSARIGREVHTALQKARGLLYKAEVSLTNTTCFGNIFYEVSGRADGVTDENGDLLVEEIKTVSGYEFAMPPDRTHMSQLLTYAYFL